MSVSKEELMKFLSHPHLASDLGICCRILQHCNIGHFYNLAHISGKLNGSS